jgi:hypothetical protein
MGKYATRVVAGAIKQNEAAAAPIAPIQKLLVNSLCMIA